MAKTTFLPEHFINRELSWLEFNARVLEEAQRESNPLLERLKFLAIFASNLDEFFMVRVAGLREQTFGDLEPQDPTADGLSPIAQLQRISLRTRQLVGQQYECWNDSLRPRLEEAGLVITSEDQLDKSQRKSLDRYFSQRVYPVLTPMAIDPSHPSPRFHNRGLYVAAKMNRLKGIGPASLFAVVQLPSVLPRFAPVDHGKLDRFVLIEDLVARRLPELFGGYEIVSTGAFRITRDMDFELLEQEGDDMVRAIESRLRERQRSEAVRLEVSANMPSDLRETIISEEQIHDGDPNRSQGYSEIYSVDGLLDMTGFFELLSKTAFNHLRVPSHTPRSVPGFSRGNDIFETIAAGDVLLHHPFDSFDPVVQFVRQAAADPQVLAIKQTLYRTSGDSPIVSALIEAAENGKQVTALVELKARFDEVNNISWARQMERAGVHVVFGFMGMKTHCKLAMVVRQEAKRAKRYVHLGTGNYNPSTATQYTDLGLFTADRTIAEDATELFNFLTGYSQLNRWQKLVVAPQDLHDRTVSLIDEQAQRARQGKRARIVAKLNSLVDRETIEALYRASQAGVPIDLVIRGICCLRPGLPGISENIRVRSIVDRFLEHTRIIIFGEGPKQKIYVGSADWMPRNFERRVEVMFPIESPELKQRVVNEIMPVYLADNQRAREMRSDGTYVAVEADSTEPLCRSQQVLLDGLSLTEVASAATGSAVAGVKPADTAAANGKKPARRKPKASQGKDGKAQSGGQKAGA